MEEDPEEADREVLLPGGHVEHRRGPARLGGVVARTLAHPREAQRRVQSEAEAEHVGGVVDDAALEGHRVVEVQGVVSAHHRARAVSARLAVVDGVRSGGERCCQQRRHDRRHQLASHRWRVSVPAT